MRKEEKYIDLTRYAAFDPVLNQSYTAPYLPLFNPFTSAVFIHTCNNEANRHVITMTTTNGSLYKSIILGKLDHHHKPVIATMTPTFTSTLPIYSAFLNKA